MKNISHFNANEVRERRENKKKYIESRMSEVDEKIADRKKSNESRIEESKAKREAMSNLKVSSEAESKELKKDNSIEFEESNSFVKKIFGKKKKK